MARHHCSIKKATLGLQVFERSISGSLLLWIKLVGPYSILNLDWGSVHYNTPGHFHLQSARTHFPWFNVSCLSCQCYLSSSQSFYHSSGCLAAARPQLTVYQRDRGLNSSRRLQTAATGPYKRNGVCVGLCGCVREDCWTFFSPLSSISLWKDVLGAARPWEKAFGLSRGQRQKDSWCRWPHTWYPPQGVIN